MGQRLRTLHHVWGLRRQTLDLGLEDDEEFADHQGSRRGLGRRPVAQFDAVSRFHRRVGWHDQTLGLAAKPAPFRELFATPFSPPRGGPLDWLLRSRSAVQLLSRMGAWERLITPARGFAHASGREGI